MEAASPVRQATSSSVRAALRISTWPRKPSSSTPGFTARIRICIPELHRSGSRERQLRRLEDATLRPCNLLQSA